MKTNWIEDLWVNSPMRAYVQQKEVDYFRRVRGLAPGATVLEIGCGRGAGARIICRTFRPARIEAIDINSAMIALARRLLRTRPALHECSATFRVGDAQRLPYDDASMDAVFNFGIIHHLENWEEGIREIARVLRPAGTFFFEEIYPALYANVISRPLLAHPRKNRFDGPEFRVALERAGLEILPGYRESRFAILGVCRRTPASGLVGRPRAVVQN